ncbi:MAG: glycosyl transferase family 4 family protein [Asticcacaulis sp.]
MNWLIPPPLLLGAFLSAILVSALLSLLIIKGGPVDIPRRRGAHHNPTPTSGGLVIMAASALILVAAILFFSRQIPGSWHDGLILFGFACVMAITGAIDDVHDLPAKWRLGLQIVICLIFASIYPVNMLDFGFNLVVQLPPIVGIIGSALWLVLVMNTINFMDGANGLAVGTQTIALLVLSGLILLMAPLSLFGGYLGVILMICLCAAGAHIGFAPFNLTITAPHKALAFQGDAGSMFAGALIGGTALVIKAYGVGSVWFGGFILAPLLVDVVMTLIVRTVKRQNILRPHNEHLYQIWLQRGHSSHGRLALYVWLLCLFGSLLGIAAGLTDRLYNTDIRFQFLVVLLAVYSVGWVILRRHLLMRPLLNPEP